MFWISNILTSEIIRPGLKINWKGKSKHCFIYLDHWARVSRIARCKETFFEDFCNQESLPIKSECNAALLLVKQYYLQAERTKSTHSNVTRLVFMLSWTSVTCREPTWTFSHWDLQPGQLGLVQDQNGKHTNSTKSRRSLTSNETRCLWGASSLYRKNGIRHPSCASESSRRSRPQQYLSTESICSKRLLICKSRKQSQTRSEK